MLLASAKLYIYLNRCLHFNVFELALTHLAPQKLDDMAIRSNLPNLPTMVALILLVILVAMLATAPHLVVAAPGAALRGDGNAPDRPNGSKSLEQSRNTSQGNGDSHRDGSSGVSNDVSRGSGSHVAPRGNISQVGRIDNNTSRASTSKTRSGDVKPGLDNPGGGNKGAPGRKDDHQGQNVANVTSREKGGSEDRSNGSSSAGHVVPVNGSSPNPHAASNATDGRGPYIYPGLVHHRRSPGSPRNGNSNHTHVAVHRLGRIRNGTGTDGHTSGRNKKGGTSNVNRRIKYRHNANKTRGNGGRGGDDHHVNNHTGNVATSGPDCKGEGGVCGDPEVVGGDGAVFYFYGHKDRDFCLVSDRDLHVNAHFIGTRPPGRTRDNTWVQALGFVSSAHTLTVAAKRNVSHWRSQEDHLDVTYNGIPLNLLNITSTSLWVSPDQAVTLTRINGAANSLVVAIKHKLRVSITVVPVSKTANQVHKYGIPEHVDCFPHLDMQFEFYHLSPSVNGVLGQTYQHTTRTIITTKFLHRPTSVANISSASNFESSSLLATDCKSSQYVRSSARSGRVHSTPPSSVNSRTVCALRSSGSSVSGRQGRITCHRRSSSRH